MWVATKSLSKRAHHRSKGNQDVLWLHERLISSSSRDVLFWVCSSSPSKMQIAMLDSCPRQNSRRDCDLLSRFAFFWRESDHSECFRSVKCPRRTFELAANWIRDAIFFSLFVSTPLSRRDTISPRTVFRTRSIKLSAFLRRFGANRLLASFFQNSTRHRELRYAFVKPEKLRNNTKPSLTRSLRLETRLQSAEPWPIFAPKQMPSTIWGLHFDVCTKNTRIQFRTTTFRVLRTWRRVRNSGRAFQGVVIISIIDIT